MKSTNFVRVIAHLPGQLEEIQHKDQLVLLHIEESLPGMSRRDAEMDVR